MAQGPGPNVCGCMSEAGSRWAGVSHLLVTFANHSKKQTYYSLSRVGGAAEVFHNRINMIRCVFQEENSTSLPGLSHDFLDDGLLGFPDSIHYLYYPFLASHLTYAEVQNLSNNF